MGLKKKTVGELEAELERINAERERLRERARQVMKERARKIHEDHLDHWGLTAQEYAGAKARQRASGVPLHTCLNEARKAARQAEREAQTARAEAADLGAEAEGV